MNERVELDRLIADLEPKVAREFVQAIQNHATQIDMVALRDALARGDIAEAERIANVEPRSLFPFGEILRGAFFGAGLLAGRRQKGVAGRFAFDGRHPDAEAWVAEQGGNLITAISEESRQSVRAVILDGFQNNRTPVDVARDIAGVKIGQKRVGGMVGLTSPQTDSLIKARYALASGDTARMRAYLKLATRDRRLDATIRKAIRDGKAITGRELDRILEAHKSKALAYRGRIISQTETRKATSAGRDQSYRQMLSLPGVVGITKRWQHNLSAEPRVEHVAMNGTVIGLDDVYRFADGTAMRYPHDEEAPARHVIGCRCIAIYRLVMEK